MKALNPEFGVGDIAKELGRRWSDVDPELKSKYEAMAEKDKARYDRVSWDCFNLCPGDCFNLYPVEREIWQCPCFSYL